ncbi:OSGI2-like protein, partial [Mya arenaria]
VFSGESFVMKKRIVFKGGTAMLRLSYLLSGYRPYYTGKPHPNSILNARLQDLDRNVSLVEQNLEPLCEGLDGRSSNPVAVLFDALTHPDADLGEDNPSLLEWRYEPQHKIDHMVLGKSRPGGSWQNMEGSMQTLSLSSWMELPGLPFGKWLLNNKQSKEKPMTERATINDVCDYYMSFVKEKKLEDNFHDSHIVTSVHKVYKRQKGACIDDESGEIEPCCTNMTKHPYHWEVRGYRMVPGCHDNSATREEFCISALFVVIATGTFDIPNKLGALGEKLSFVSHSLHEFESVINHSKLSESHDPVLVVGAGLSAADAILMALQSQVPIVHAFRRNANDSNLILRKLPKNMYPEYHKIHSLMKGTEQNPLYKAMARQDIVEIKEDKSVLLKPHKKGSDDITSLNVSHIGILIGSRPDLSFLPHEGREIGVLKKYPIQSKHNPIDIDPYSYQCVHELGLFAMGPLVGDNFVRFGQGGALGIANYLSSRNKQ